MEGHHRLRVILALAVLVAACGGGTAVTTTTAPPATAASTTTTATLPAATEIATGTSGIQKWFPGTVYTASEFWVPVSFTVEEDGVWWAKDSSEVWVYLEYHEDGESRFNLDVSILAHAPRKSVEEVVAALIDTEPNELVDRPVSQEQMTLSDPSPTTVAGFDAEVFDLRVVYDLWHDEFPLGSTRFPEVYPGVSVLAAAPMKFGVRNGRAARIWVVDVDGSTITIIAAVATQELVDEVATFNEELFNELIPAADALVAGIEFHP